MRTILLTAATLAAVAFSLPADARVHHRPYWGAYGSGYWGTHGYWSPSYRGRDIPLKDRFFLTTSCAFTVLGRPNERRETACADGAALNGAMSAPMRSGALARQPVALRIGSPGV